MEINILPILKNEGEKLFFSFDESIEKNIVEFCGESVDIQKPLNVSGYAINYDGKIHLHMNIKTEIQRAC